MTGYFLMTFAALAALELIKGLSANGTPPVLQRFSWQMDLAHFMWSTILFFRIAFVAALVWICLLYTSPSPRDAHESRMPSSA